MNPARRLCRILALLMLPLVQLGGAGVLLANERQSDEADGYYFALSSAAVSPFSLNTTSPTLSPARIRTRSGHEVGAGVGYRAAALRIEGKIHYGRFDADSIRFAEGGGPLSGYFDLRGATLEVLHDLPGGARLRPYLGTGLGVVRFRAREVTLAGFPPTDGDNTLVSHQVMAGAAYTAPAWRLTLGYRQIRIGAQEYETGGVPLRAAPLRMHAIELKLQRPF